MTQETFEVNSAPFMTTFTFFPRMQIFLVRLGETHPIERQLAISADERDGWNNLCFRHKLSLLSAISITERHSRFCSSSGRPALEYFKSCLFALTVNFKRMKSIFLYISDHVCRSQSAIAIEWVYQIRLTAK